MDDLHGEPEVQARLGRVHANILTWPEPRPREEYDLTLTPRQYRAVARFASQVMGLQLREVEEHV